MLKMFARLLSSTPFTTNGLATPPRPRITGWTMHKMSMTYVSVCEQQHAYEYLCLCVCVGVCMCVNSQISPPPPPPSIKAPYLLSPFVGVTTCILVVVSTIGNEV